MKKIIPVLGCFVAMCTLKANTETEDTLTTETTKQTKRLLTREEKQRLRTLSYARSIETVLEGMHKRQEIAEKFMQTQNHEEKTD